MLRTLYIFYDFVEVLLLSFPAVGGWVKCASNQSQLVAIPISFLRRTIQVFCKPLVILNHPVTGIGKGCFTLFYLIFSINYCI